MNTSLTNIGRGFKPTIIGVADSTHYLVGTVDTSNNFIGLIKTDDIVVKNSLSEAKKFLRDHNVVTANVEFQTAYDEMCGTSTSGSYRQTIAL